MTIESVLQILVYVFDMVNAMMLVFKSIKITLNTGLQKFEALFLRRILQKIPSVLQSLAFLGLGTTYLLIRVILLS